VASSSPPQRRPQNSTGAIIAFLVHTGKATSRPAVNAATGGTGAPLASFAEDALAVGLALVAIFVPMLVTVLLLGIAGAVYYIVTTGRRRRRTREMRLAQEREERKAALDRGEKVAWWRVSWRERLERSDSRLMRAGRSAGRRSTKADGEDDA
jgi:Flp pilus assembly protein TadB